LTDGRVVVEEGDRGTFSDAAGENLLENRWLGFKYPKAKAFAQWPGFCGDFENRRVAKEGWTCNGSRSVLSTAEAYDGSSQGSRGDCDSIATGVSG
jgi:hypothetical protein